MAHASHENDLPLYSSRSSSSRQHNLENVRNNIQQSEEKDKNTPDERYEGTSSLQEDNQNEEQESCITSEQDFIENQENFQENYDSSKNLVEQFKIQSNLADSRSNMYRNNYIKFENANIATFETQNMMIPAPNPQNRQNILSNPVSHNTSIETVINNESKPQCSFTDFI